MWHCPHCGAPQAESARCWVCRRSSTTCSTCRHFQSSLSADVGWCALDVKRRPLTGLEQRGCWQERPASLHATAHDGADSRRQRRRVQPDDGLEPQERPPFDFIPVELVDKVVIPGASPRPRDDMVEAPAPPIAPLLEDPEDRWTERTSLFGEPEV